LKYNIGVTGTGSLIGQAIIKCIIRSEFNNEYNLIGFDYFENTVGSFWCYKNYILPDILKGEVKKEWLQTIKNVIAKEDLKVLFIGIDFELPLFSELKLEIEMETGCIIVVSSHDVIHIGNDKYLTYNFLKEHKIEFPQTFLPGDYKGELAYPVIVKPRVGARSIGVYKVNSDEELNTALSKVDEPIIQELVGNDSEEYTCGVICIDGTLKQSIVLRRTLKLGNTFTSEYHLDFPGSISLYIKEITEKLKPFGACNFQLRLDTEGRPKLFEINPRHSGTTYIRSLFGYNEVIYLLKYFLAGEETLFEMKEGRAIRYFDEVLI